MKQEDKELLLKDLSARLPYGVKCQFENTIETIKEIWFCEDESWQVDGEKTSTCIHAVKPYLFPLSSMTETQRNEYHDLLYNPKHGIHIDYFDWCHKNKLDCRGLIPMGLAIDATGLNIY